MERKEDVTQVLNDLLKINNDRIKEYRKATKHIVDFDWRNLFLSMIDESRKFVLELGLEIIKRGGTPQMNSTTTSGKIYRFWMELKDTFTGTDRESILNECEFVEDGAVKAYRKALDHEDLSPELKALIRHQYELVASSQSTMNHYRDIALLNLFKSAYR